MTKPTVEQLEELSAKATLGGWERDCLSHYDPHGRFHYVEHHLTGHLRDRVCTANHSDAQALTEDENGICSDEQARADLEFIAALVNFWRSGGAELVRDFEWLTKAKLITVQTKDKLFSIDGARLSAVLRVARKDMSAELKGEGNE